MKEKYHKDVPQHSTSESLNKDEVLAFYYAGHGFVQDDGSSTWLTTDTVFKNGMSPNGASMQ